MGTLYCSQAMLRDFEKISYKLVQNYAKNGIKTSIVHLITTFKFKVQSTAMGVRAVMTRVRTEMALNVAPLALPGVLSPMWIKWLKTLLKPPEYSKVPHARKQKR